MTQEKDKYRLVNGQVYRLAKSFTDPREAVEYARNMKAECRVSLVKLGHNLWSVYWRSKEEDIECSIDV